MLLKPHEALFLLEQVNVNSFLSLFNNKRDNFLIWTPGIITN